MKLAQAQRQVFDLRPEDARWEDFVGRQPGALPYHLPGWSQAIRETFGYRPAALGCADETGQVTGVLPLFEKKSLTAGRYLCSLPHTPTAGPFATDPGSVRALLSAAATRVDETPASWLQVRVTGAGLDGLAEGFSGREVMPTYAVALPASPDDLRFGSSSNRSQILRAVRKASRCGVTVREASSVQDVRRWYRLYLETMRTHATPPRPLRFFETMWAFLASRGHLRLLLAERQAGSRTVLLAGSVFLRHGTTVIYAFNGRDRGQLEFRPNDAIHWHAITEACRAGFRRYDLGEVDPRNQGLARFKTKWGAEPSGLYRYRYPSRHEAAHAMPPAGPGDGSVRQAGEWAWRRLPLPVTAALGRWMYRRL